MNIPTPSLQEINQAQPVKPATVLFGRLMLPDQSEHPFQISQISPDGATFICSAEVPADVDILAYIDEIGRVEGTVKSQIDGGITVEFKNNDTRRARIEQKLKWLSENDREAANQRRHERFEPKDNNSHITMPDGRVYACEVIDISLSGAAIKTPIMPNLGTYVLLGKMRGRVVRYVEDGLAIEFVRPLSQTALQSQMR